ncbi:MAG: DUF6531 domain-containing protein [Candidatus Omnitrophota bacterium]
MKPNSGSFVIGSSITVSWTCNALPNDSMTISLKHDTCTDCSVGPYYQVLTSNTPNDGKETFVIPTGITPTSGWRIYVKHNNSQVYGCGENITINNSTPYKTFTVDSYWHSIAYPDHWLDTGIDVASGQQLVIASSGQGCLAAPNSCFGPDGDPGAGLFNGCHFGALVGKIGTNGSIFCLGSNFQGTMPSTGRLYLGYNDSDYENNSGSFDVKIGQCSGTRLNNPILNSPANGATNVGTPTNDNKMASVEFKWNLNNPSDNADSWLSVRNLSTNHIIFSQNVGNAQSYTLDLGFNTQYRWNVTAVPKNTSYCSSDGINTTFTTTGPLSGYKISGRVFDTDNVTGIPNVTIRILGQNIDNNDTQTNSDGTFTLGTIHPLAPGTYTITPSMAGKRFYPDNRTVKLVSTDETGVNFRVDNAVPVVLITSPAPGASVSGAIVINGSAYTEVTVGADAGIDEIKINIDGVDKAWAVLPQPDYTYNLGGLLWKNGSGNAIKNWNEILPSGNSADLQVIAKGYGGKYGYSPHISLMLGEEMNVSITSPTINDMPVLKGSTINAESSVSGGVTPYTYQWRLDEVPVGTSPSISFTADNILAHYLNLTVTDKNENTATARVQILVDLPSISGDPDNLVQASAGYGVNVVNGNFFMQRTDLSLPAVGLPIVFTRSYNSARSRAMHEGSLGRGWTHNYNISLLIESNNGTVHITWGDGLEETFMLADGIYKPASMGNLNLLVKNGSNYVLIDKDQTRYLFNSSGVLSSIVDRQGNTLMLAYTGANLTEIRNTTSGRYLTFTYSSGKISNIVDNANRSVSFSYNANGYLSGVTDLRGQTEKYQYLSKPNCGGSSNIYLLEKIVDKKGNTILSNTYSDSTSIGCTYPVLSQTDNASRTYTINYVSVSETDVINPLSQQTKFFIDEAGRVKDIVDAQGYKHSTLFGNDYRAFPSNAYEPLQNTGNTNLSTSFKYSSEGRGNLTDIWEPSPSGSESNRLHHRMTYTVDPAVNKNLLTSYIDPANNAIQINYNSNDLPNTIIYPSGNASDIFTYNSNGQVLTKTTNRDGITQVFNFEYANSFKDLTKVTTPLGNKTAYTYDAAGHVTSITDPQGKLTSFTYQGDLLKTKVAPIDGTRKATTTYSYDNNGKLIDIQLPMGQHIKNEYNNLGLLIKTTYPSGEVFIFEYDPLNRLKRKKYTTKGLNPLEYTYDKRGNLEKIGYADLNETLLAYNYNGNGNVKTESDGMGRTKTYTYDNMNRLTRIDYPDKTYETFTYTPLSEVETHVDRRGNTTRYTYDSMNRVKTVTEPVQNGTSVTTRINYDTVGNIKEIINAKNKTIRFEYDNDNRMVKRIEDATGAALTDEYEYYPTNLLKKYTVPDGTVLNYTYYDSGWLRTAGYSGGTISYTYSDCGYLTRMTDPAGSTTFGRDPIGKLTQRTDAFGNRVAYRYDTFGRVGTITYPGGKQVTYTYDAAQRLKTVTSWLGTMASYSYNGAGQVNGATLGNGTKTNIGFDATGRINNMTHKKSDNTIIASYQFALDGNGNKISASVIQPLLPVINPQTVNYSYDSADRLVSAGNKTFTFNKRGVLTGISSSQGNYSLNFDPLDQLISLTDPSGKSDSFVYDGQGNRLSQIVNGKVTRYVLDENKELPDVLMEMNSSNTPQRYYIYGLGLIAQTDGAGGNPKYYHFDVSGSTTALSDATQAITDAYAYDSFGNLAGQIGNTPNPFRYVGQYGVQDAPAGLQFMRARYYMPEVGRFISRDKVWGSPEQSQSLNLFVYVENNPINKFDSSGNFSVYQDPGVVFDFIAKSVKNGLERGVISTSDWLDKNVGPILLNAADTLDSLQPYAKWIPVVGSLTDTTSAVLKMGPRKLTPKESLVKGIGIGIGLLVGDTLPNEASRHIFDYVDQITGQSEKFATEIIDLGIELKNYSGVQIEKNKPKLLRTGFSEKENSIIFDYWKKYNEKQLRNGGEKLIFEVYKQKWGALALKKYREGK